MEKLRTIDTSGDMGEIKKFFEENTQERKH